MKSKIFFKFKSLFHVVRCKKYGQQGHNVKACYLKKVEEATSSISKPSRKQPSEKQASK